MLLTIAVSYLLSANCNDELLIYDQIKNLEKYIPEASYNLINIIYVIQSSEIKRFETLKENLEKNNLQLRISFIYGGKKGVAKSRNIAIKESNSKFLLFFDSDCKFNREISDFLNYLKSTKTQTKYIFFSKDTNYKSESLSFLPTINKIAILPRIIYDFAFASIAIIKSPTYNIIVNPYFCRQNNIFFDPNLGLGSYYRQSDEALFLINLFKSLSKNKLKFSNLHLADIVDAESKSHEIKSELFYSLQSKGYVLRKGFNIFLGILFILPVSIIFAVKFYKFKNPFFTVFFVLKGFIKPRNFN